MLKFASTRRNLAVKKLRNLEKTMAKLCCTLTARKFHLQPYLSLIKAEKGKINKVALTKHATLP